MSVSTSPTTKTPVPLSPDSTGNGTTEVMGEWEVVREEEGKVEGVTTTVLWLLHVEKEQEGEYRCRVQYKGCTVYSQSASLTILSDGTYITTHIAIILNTILYHLYIFMRNYIHTVSPQIEFLAYISFC